MQNVVTTSEESLWQQFPANIYVQRLLDRCRAMGVHLARSGVNQQWLYHPAYRTIFVWEDDLQQESLSYLVVILAHELGHAMDFDQHPAHILVTSNLHWSEAPTFIEKAAFVNGFVIMKELHIPFSLEQYASMIDGTLAAEVVADIERDHLCCLLSERKPVLEPAPQQAELQHVS